MVLLLNREEGLDSGRLRHLFSIHGAPLSLLELRDSPFLVQIQQRPKSLSQDLRLPLQHTSDLSNILPNSQK